MQNMTMSHWNRPPNWQRDHINDRHLPDKAIDVMDEAGANLHLQPVAERGDRVTVEIIENIVAKMARIPAKKRIRFRSRRTAHHGARPEADYFWPGSRNRGAGHAIKMSRSGLREEEDRSGPSCLRVYRRRQDRGYASPWRC